MSDELTNTSPNLPSRVLVLIATIPARRKSCERVLDELTRQTRPPDGIVLVLDGYGAEPAPKCALPIAFERRTDKLSGAGARWRVLPDLLPDDIIICLDDDMILFMAPKLVENLAASVAKHECAAAPMGRTFDGKGAPPGKFARGDLLHAAGHGISGRVSMFSGLHAFADEVKAKGGPDALGPGGDDDTIVSAYLWKAGIAIKHVATGNQYTQPGIISTFKKQDDPNIQKRAIAAATGWPWKTYSVGWLR